MRVHHEGFVSHPMTEKRKKNLLLVFLTVWVSFMSIACFFLEVGLKLLIPGKPY